MITAKLKKSMNVLSFDNSIEYTNSFLIYKILHNLAPSPLSEFANIRTIIILLVFNVD